MISWICRRYLLLQIRAVPGFEAARCAAGVEERACSFSGGGAPLPPRAPKPLVRHSRRAGHVDSRPEPVCRLRDPEGRGAVGFVDGHRSCPGWKTDDSSCRRFQPAAREHGCGTSVLTVPHEHGAGGERQGDLLPPRLLQFRIGVDGPTAQVRMAGWRFVRKHLETFVARYGRTADRRAMDRDLGTQRRSCELP
jgi:hypothetical protein